MRLLLDETFATATYTLPLSALWVEVPPGLDVEAVTGLTTELVGADTAALIPSGSIIHLQQSHVVAPEIATIADGQGAIAMRTPVRPDEVEATPIRLLATSETALVLARATLRPFYGIEATRWITAAGDPDAAHAEVVIVEGAEALREPEGGFNEDLCRAWFILHAQPVVTHVLAIPRELPVPDRQAVISFLTQVRTEGVNRRRDWRPDLAARQGIPTARAGEFWGAQRYELLPDDRAALLTLLQKGSGLHPRLHSGMLFASDMSDSTAG